MKKHIILCDICGREIEEKDDRKPFTYSLYKIDKGLWYEQDLCSLCYMKIYNAIKECKKDE